VKQAFTMIELIFVIVILGTLASVALPKLAATRDDAKKVNLILNSKVCINDIISFYKGLGIAPDIASIPSCVIANSTGATIVISGDFVTASGIGLASLDGNHRMKSVTVSF
jgi:general secretion pathway protein G